MSALTDELASVHPAPNVTETINALDSIARAADAEAQRIMAEVVLSEFAKDTEWSREFMRAAGSVLWHRINGASA